MPSLRDQFAHFYMPGEDAIATAMTTGLVVPDANVLLNAYRFQRTARDELFGALEKVGGRLWVPHQVGLEFHQTRLAVMADQEDYLDKAGETIVARMNDYLNAVKSLAKRIGLPPSTVSALENEVQKAHSAVMLGKFWGDAKADAIRADDHASDPVLARIDVLLDGRVGVPMDEAELKAARAEAERRGRDKVPPGYRDHDKVKGDPAGDYLVWRQLTDEAAERKPPAVVFITDDVKDDWYQRERGRTLGARRELRAEMMAEAGVPLMMMTTDAFLHHAGKYLDAEISDETIAQAEERPGQVQPVAQTVTLTPEQWVSLWPEMMAGMSEKSLEQLRSGEFTNDGLYIALGLLTVRLGKEEAMKVVGRELEAGLASGALPFDRAAEAARALVRFASMNTDQPQSPEEVEVAEPPAR
jgi:hypothetical protein